MAHDAGSRERVLALDIRSQRVGYAVFEGPHELLDWGLMHGTDSVPILVRRLHGLCRVFMPSVVLTRRIEKRDRRDRQGIQTVRTVAQMLNIPLHLVNRDDLYRYFSRVVKTSKYDRARMIAERFPELAARLPRKRRPWESEPARIMIFDAASLGIVYFAHDEPTQ